MRAIDTLYIAITHPVRPATGRTNLRPGVTIVLLIILVGAVLT